ncbi:MAG: hypothetical protein ABEJ26_13865 [Halosimplex sp.]
MSSHRTRRALLGTVGAALAGGCLSGGSGTATPHGPKTYGIAVHNRIGPDDFERATHQPEPEPAVVHLRVTTIGGESHETLFERTVEVDPGGSETVSEAFTTEPDGPTYAMNARVEPFSEDTTAREEMRQEGLTFSHRGSNAPTDPIPVIVDEFRNAPMLTPTIDVRRTASEE